jgi:hypothetical protein
VSVYAYGSVGKRKLYTDPTQDLYNFEARASATPGRKHDFSRHSDLERLELFLARITFQPCALNVPYNLLYTQPAKQNRFDSRQGGRRCDRGYTHALRITPHAYFATAPFSFNFGQIPGLLNLKKLVLEEAKQSRPLNSLTSPKTFCFSKNWSPS